MNALEKITNNNTSRALLITVSSTIVSFAVKEIADRIWLKSTDTPPPDKAEKPQGVPVKAMVWVVAVGAVSSFLSLLTKRKIQEKASK
jgi:chemotaxis signal transduction protein